MRPCVIQRRVQLLWGVPSSCRSVYGMVCSCWSSRGLGEGGVMGGYVCFLCAAAAMSV